MDAVVTRIGSVNTEANRPSQKDAEEAVRNLLAWAGEDPTREGLLDTPTKRVAKATRNSSAVTTKTRSRFWAHLRGSGRL